VRARVLRRAADRLRSRAARRSRYDEFRARVEPGLRPRVHRFAAVPEPLEGHAPLELAVCIDVEGGGDARATRASLDLQTVRPAAVAEARGVRALEQARSGWVVVVRAGDRLAGPALEALGRAVSAAPGAALITCDEDLLDRSGHRRDPRCRPGPSPDFLFEHDVSGSLVAVARGPATALAGSLDAGSAWRYELALRLSGPDGAGHAHVPSILCHGAARPRSDARAEAAAAARVLAEREPAARVERAGPGRRRVRRPLRDEPSVEVVVCFRDRPDLLSRCAQSVLHGTDYDRLSLRLVDNDSREPETRRLLDALARDERVAVDRHPGPFNFAALNNAAAGRSQADVLAFLNNDVEALASTWAEDLLEHAGRPEVGAVAPLLLYGDGRVQHAGAAIGLHGYAGHPFAGLRPDRTTPFGAAADGTRNWLAVSAACMMVERRKFEAAGGFDEGFTVGGNDVDLCLRLTAAGHRSLCVPHVRLRHDESASRDPRDIPAGDFERSRERYGAFRTVGDPFYNPNLTLADTSCAMRTPGEEMPA
jgi:GT2 family glycosyltransferase